MAKFWWVSLLDDPEVVKLYSGQTMWQLSGQLNAPRKQLYRLAAIVLWPGKLLKDSSEELFSVLPATMRLFTIAFWECAAISSGRNCCSRGPQ